MRMFIVNLLAAGLVALSASSAGAVSLTLAGVDEQVVAQGDQISVTVTLDTEATTGITLMSIGVLFDDSRLSYNQALSTTTAYILYDSGAKGGGNYLSASTECGGGFGSPTAGAGCNIRVGTTNQVNVDYVNSNLTSGTGAGNVGVELLVTLVFDVNLDAPDGNADISLSQTSPGNVIGQPGGGGTTATLNGSGFVSVPEPGVAGLSLAALLTVGGLRIRSRQRR